jgi:hypothetical protein
VERRKCAENGVSHTGLKPIVDSELLGPVATDESDPLFMGADGHSNNTGGLLAIAEALLCQWLKDTERSLSPVLRLFCLDSEYAANATVALKGPARCIRTLCRTRLIEKGKQLC